MKVKELQELIKDLDPEAEILMNGSYSYSSSSCHAEDCYCYDTSYIDGEKQYNSLCLIRIQKPKRKGPPTIVLELN